MEKIPVEIVVAKEGVSAKGRNWTIWKIITDDGYELESFNRPKDIEEAIEKGTPLEFKQVTYNQQYNSHQFKFADPVVQLQQKQESLDELMDEAEEVFG